MVESFAARVIIDLSLVFLVVASVIEVAADVRDTPMPQFLSGTLGSLPSSHPATVLGLLGVLGVVLGVVYEVLFFGLPGGRFVVGAVAIVAFLFAGGYLISGD
jgi:acid phosphatase family membrane protein YuiD